MKGRTTIGMMFYQALRGFFLKHYYYEMSRPVEFRDLDHALVDDQGRTYYEFPDPTALPVERLLQQQKFLITHACTYMEEAIENSSDRKLFARNAAKVYAILEDIKSRAGNIIPLDIFVNVLCCSLVREDENPVKFNESIHREKCDYFIEHLDDYGFFFRLQSFKWWARQLRLSSENWSEILSAWERSLRRIKQSSKIFNSPDKSTEAQKKKKSSS